MTWDKNNLIDIIEKSKCKSDVLKMLNLRVGGDNWKTLDKYIKEYNIDISHFKILNGGKDKIKLDNILIENSNYSRQSLKKRLYSENILRPICSLCGQDENWNGMKISLILDHINGVHNDNRLENLRIVCPNCNAGLDTFAGKNSKKSKSKYYCKCGREMGRQSKLCINCFSIKRRIVERPSYENLLKELENSNYTAVGRKYGVSDKAIRKWIKKYEN